MQTPLIDERTLAFLLYEFLDTEALLERPRYRDHSREVFDATLATARTIAQKFFANHFARGDAAEACLRDGRVETLPENLAAYRAVAEAGFMAAHLDYEAGGLQLPEVIMRAALAQMSAANLPTAGTHLLTMAAARLLRQCGSPALIERYLAPLCDGRFAGTMAMTEPEQGSSLADLRTRAQPQADGTYRLFGQKIFITGGEHEMTENIVHLVLARITGAPAGVGGISLFLCPKYLVNDDGSRGPRNDVVVTGLLHKMGNRNSITTALRFGEQEGAVAYLVGEPHQGLRSMFEMMNDARIWVGINTAALACRSFAHALDYARTRLQGRLPSCKDPLSPQVALVEHADVRRMLLAQKAYAEGALALSLYACALAEDQVSAAEPAARQQAGELLDLLTPVVKSWSARYGTRATDLAIQVLGGAGYCREHPVEQLYRDCRLSMIYEGAEGIHGLDLLGRKVMQGRGFSHFREAVVATLHEAETHAATRDYIHPLHSALQGLDETTRTLREALAADPDRGLANASLYLDAFGRLTVAWLWLRQGILAARALEQTALPAAEADFYRGKLQAAHYYLRWELPEIHPLLALLQGQDATCFDMQDAWF